VVYRLKDLDVTVTFTYGSQREQIVELALGSEVRKLPFAEFVHFWLSIIEEGRQADCAHLESLKEPQIATTKKI